MVVRHCIGRTRSKYIIGIVLVLSLCAIQFFVIFPSATSWSKNVNIPDYRAFGGMGGNTPLYPNGFLQSQVGNTDIIVPDEQGTYDVKILYPDVVRDDLKHTPIATSIAYSYFAGIQPSVYTTSGIDIFSDERDALEQYMRDLNILNTTKIKGREVLPRLIQGNSVNNPLALRQFTDRYFVQQTHGAPFRELLCREFTVLMNISNKPPLVVNLEASQTASFVQNCLYFRNQPLQNSKRKFVLLVSYGNQSADASFSSIDTPDVNTTFLLSHPLLAHWYAVNGNIRHPKFTSLPTGYFFFHRSGRSLLTYSPQRRKVEETRHSFFFAHFLHNIDLKLLFPKTATPLQFGTHSCMWLETAMNVFASRWINPMAQWIEMDNLPKRITTVYVVLVPLEREKNNERPSLTSQVMVFNEPGSNNPGPAAAQHIALLPFTAALYHKLVQNPYGNPQKPANLLVAQDCLDDSVCQPLLSDSQVNSLNNYTVYLNRTDELQYYAAIHNITFYGAPTYSGSLDTSATWEALSLGLIPILLSPSLPPSMEPNGTAIPSTDVNGLTDVYADLPVIIVNTTAEITAENLERWRQEVHAKMERGEYKLEKLFAQYWIDQINGHSNND